MDINKFAEQSQLPLKVLNWMVAKRIIQNPLSREDVLGLNMLEKVWGNRELLRSQLGRFSRERRLKIVMSADFKTKWERYAFSRFLNLPPGEKLSMKKLIDEIELTFNFPLEDHHRRRLYKVREKAYNWRKKVSKSGKQIKET